MIKTIYLLLILPFFCSAQKVTPDTLVLIAPQIYDWEVASFWQNFDTIDLENKHLICYYDVDRKYKIFEGNPVNGSWQLSSYELYYLNGNLRESFRYNPKTNKTSVKSYYLNGDPKWVKNEDFTSQEWEYNLERKLVTTRKTFKSPKCQSTGCLSTIWFDALTGDTTCTLELFGVYSRTFSSGQLVMVKKELSDGFAERVFCPIDKRTYLHLKIDPLSHHAPAQSDRDRDRKIWINAFDSLAHYKNLKDLSIHLTDTAMLSIVTDKLKILPQLTKLRSITLTGCFTEIPPGVLNSKQLKSLSLFQTDIRLVPEEINKLEQLNSFSLSYHPSIQYAKSLENLAQLPKLYTLGLNYPVDSLIPIEIEKIKSLKVLGLQVHCEKSYEDMDVRGRQMDSLNLDFLMSLKELEQINLCYKLRDSPMFTKYRMKAVGLQVNFDGYECFTPETEITLFNGEHRKIKDLEVGDELAGYNEQSKKIESTTINIVHKYAVLSPDVVEITCVRKSGEEIRVNATPEHPFFVDGSWVKVRDMEKGQTLTIYWDDQLETVRISNMLRFKSEVDMVYNLNTSLHTFFANRILVHNK